jgi:hypothetical protein
MLITSWLTINIATFPIRSNEHHYPTTSLFDEYKYRQRWVTYDSESEDEDMRFCKKYCKKEAGASYSFFCCKENGKSLEIRNPQLNIFRWTRRQWRRLWM